MKINVEIASYDECREALIEFRNANRESTRDIAYFDWRYRGRPNGREAIIVWARDTRGDNIGSLSLIPNKFSFGGSEEYVGVLGDISVSPSWRGQGVAQNMLEHLIQSPAVRGLAGCFVLPNEGAARSLQRAGWRRVTEIRRFVIPTDVTQAVTRRIPAPAGVALARIGNWAAQQLRARVRDRRIAPYVCSLVDEVDERFDVLWKQMATENVIIGARDRPQLVWRYVRHPLENYHIAAVTRDGVLSGYVIFRIQQTRCFIDDFLCAQWRTEVRQVLACFVEWVRTRFETSSVSLRGNADAIGAGGFLTQTWVKRRDSQLVLYRPNGVESVNNMGIVPWFVTAGDKDV